MSMPKIAAEGRSASSRPWPRSNGVQSPQPPALEPGAPWNALGGTGWARLAKYRLDRLLALCAIQLLALQAPLLPPAAAQDRYRHSLSADAKPADAMPLNSRGLPATNDPAEAPGGGERPSARPSPHEQALPPTLGNLPGSRKLSAEADERGVVPWKDLLSLEDSKASPGDAAEEQPEKESQASLPKDPAERIPVLRSWTPDTGSAADQPDATEFGESGDFGDDFSWLPVTERRRRAGEGQPVKNVDTQALEDLAPSTASHRAPKAPPRKPMAHLPKKERPSPPAAVAEVSAMELTLTIGAGKIVRFQDKIDTVLLANPSIADIHMISPKATYVFGNAIGRTDLFALDGNGEVLAMIELRVRPDTELAEKELEIQHPEGSSRLSVIGDHVVAKGELTSLEEAIDVAASAESLAQTADELSNQTTLSGSQQINLRVRFAEVRSNDIHRLGINWQAIFDRGDFILGLATGNLAGVVDSFARDLTGSVFGNIDAGSVDVDILIEALQREGIVNILAEPNLTALNGQPASFLAGGEFPFPVPNSEGATTIEFREFGVSLNFIATLLPGNRIAIQVRPEVSQISFGSGIAFDGIAVPLLTVRRAETSIELGSGQTFAIAGLFQRNLSTDIDKFPLLAEIPILGTLFRSVSYQQEETELVVLITPYLVEPVSEKDLLLPGQRRKATEPVRETAAGSTRGMAGFILD